MSNLENANINNQNNNNQLDSDGEFDFDEEFNFDEEEIPQLVRRNGTIQSEKVQGYFLLEKAAEKMFKEDACPICLCEEEELYPLFCGHSFCENDINNLLIDSQQKQNVVSCPICRRYQHIESFKQLQELNYIQLNTVQKETNLTY